MPYAENTNVPIEQSRAEIEKIITRNEAGAFMYGQGAQGWMIQFEAHGRLVRFSLGIPDIKDYQYAKVGRHSKRRLTESEQRSRHEQAIRQRWRALRLAIQAKFEAVAAGISVFEREFLSHIVDPATGRTVYEVIAPRLRDSYDKGPRRLALPSPESPTPAIQNGEGHA